MGITPLDSIQRHRVLSICLRNVHSKYRVQVSIPPYKRCNEVFREEKKEGKKKGKKKGKDEPTLACIYIWICLELLIISGPKQSGMPIPIGYSI